MSSLSPERATDVGLGVGEILVSGIAAWGLSNGVQTLGEIIEKTVQSVWETEYPVVSATQGMPFRLAPAQFIPVGSALQSVQACTNSGSAAAIAVGFTETLHQTYRYAKSDHEKSWGTDMIEGGYRGAGVGAMTGFLTGGEYLGQRIAAAVVGALVGCVMGNGIAGIGHVIRSIHVPK